MGHALLSAFRLIIGMCCGAGAIALALSVAAEWGELTGVVHVGGTPFALLVIGEAVAVLALAGLLIGSTRLDQRP
jgi:hypothetical protein